MIVDKKVRFGDLLEAYIPLVPHRGTRGIRIPLTGCYVLHRVTVLSGSGGIAYHFLLGTPWFPCVLSVGSATLVMARPTVQFCPAAPFTPPPEMTQCYAAAGLSPALFHKPAICVENPIFILTYCLFGNFENQGRGLVRVLFGKTSFDTGKGSCLAFRMGGNGTFTGNIFQACV